MLSFTLDHTPVLDIASVFDHTNKQIIWLEIENKMKPNVVGNIYVGKVIAIADGMEGAFVDIGLSTNAYIQRNDLLRACKISPSKVKEMPLSKLVKRGQLIVAQVDKAPYQTKGAQLTTDISLTGQHVVFLPYLKGIKVSRKASGNREIAPLEEKLKAAMNNQYGLIVRSAALNNGVEDASIISESLELMKRWEDLLKKSELINTPKCIYKIEALSESIIEMLKLNAVENFYVETEEDRLWLMEIGVEKKKIVVKKSGTSLFQDHGVSLDKLLNTVQFSSPEGVSVTINELEAFSIADVNSAKYNMDMTKRKNVFDVNAIAAQLILNQILTQKISGVILIDFIDMNVDERLSFIQHLLSNGYDKSNRIQIEGFTTLGILEMTRKRENSSLKDLLSFNYGDRDLMYWQLNELFIDLKRLQNHTNTKKVTVEVDEVLYVFLRQNPIFETLELKIELKHNFASQKNYKIHTAKH